MNIKIINQEYMLRSGWHTVRKDDFFVNDKKVEGYFVVESSDVVLIAAINNKNEILLKREYRYPKNEILTEIPGGMFSIDEESPMDAAKRELKEETGCESDEWELLGKTYDNSARNESSTYLFLTKNCVQTAEQDLDENEKIFFIESMWIPFKEAFNMVLKNEINVNNSANAILRCAVLYPGLLN